MPVGTWSVTITLLISDANIFIDMEEGGLIRKMFRLPEIFVVPDILFVEELSAHHPTLPAYGLQIKALEASAIEEAIKLSRQYKQPSQNDLFALALAQQELCPLVTGDRRLREAANNEKVEVKGTLWLIERMFEEKLLTKDDARKAYDKMREANRRLPWAKVAQQLKSFERG